MYYGFSYDKKNKSETLFMKGGVVILIIKNDIITVMGNLSCKQIKSIKIEIPWLEISPDSFLDEFINEKVVRVKLYPN
ncbi:hypothetical protein HZS_1529 [Henneguya salminicola]|nr:hypothetical protein HZS_1529 [Henneguya salminicola]